MDYKKLKYIGDIYEIDKDANSPKINTIINKPIKEKKKIIQYLNNGKKIAVAPAAVKDIITGRFLTLELYLMSDGIYKWRSDLVYYLEKYDIELPDEFIQHVLNQ